MARHKRGWVGRLRWHGATPRGHQLDVDPDTAARWEATGLVERVKARAKAKATTL